MSTITSKENSKFPKWDIVPPFQFINPRIRTDENKTQETSESKNDLPRTILLENKNKIEIQANIPETSIEGGEKQKCPACGKLTEINSKFCKDCGLSLSTDNQESNSDNITNNNVIIIKCLNCGAELELDESNDVYGTYECPECGNEFNYTG